MIKILTVAIMIGHLVTISGHLVESIRRFDDEFSNICDSNDADLHESSLVSKGFEKLQNGHSGGFLTPVLSSNGIESILHDGIKRFQHYVRQRSEMYHDEFVRMAEFVDKLFDIDEEAVCVRLPGGKVTLHKDCMAEKFEGDLLTMDGGRVSTLKEINRKMKDDAQVFLWTVLTSMIENNGDLVEDSCIAIQRLKATLLYAPANQRMAGRQSAADCSVNPMGNANNQMTRKEYTWVYQYRIHPCVEWIRNKSERVCLSSTGKYPMPTDPTKLYVTC